MSKTDYCNVLFKGLPKYPIQGVNKLVQACGGFMKYKCGELALMKLVFNGLSNQNMPENLQLKLSKEKRSLRKNSVMLVHQNEIIKSAYLEEANKVFNDVPNKIREDIDAMSF